MPSIRAKVDRDFGEGTVGFQANVREKRGPILILKKSENVLKPHETFDGT